VRGKYAGKLADLRRAAAERPESVVAQFDLASLEMELFSLDEAAARLGRLRERFPRLAAVRYNLGLTLTRQGRFAEAAQELRASIDLGLSTATAWNNLAIALRRAGEIEAAEEAFRRALQVDARHCDAAVNLGRLYLALDDTRRARTAFVEARRRVCPADVLQLSELYLVQAEELERR
jgi:Flp pilus assembly protein TadD